MPDYARAIVLPPPVTDPALCLGPTDVIESEHPRVRELVERVGRSPRSLFDAVRNEIRYDLAPKLTDRASWAASATIERRSGFCQQKAVVLAAALRCAGVPAAIDFQHIRDHKLMVPRFERVLPGGVIAFHGRVQAYLDGQWKILDPTLETSLCAARGYRVMGFDGGGLPKTDAAGDPHFDELGRAGPFADLPVAVSDAALALAPLWKELQSARDRGATM